MTLTLETDDYMTQKDSFIFYRSFFEATKPLPAEDKAALFEAIAEYALNQNQIELTPLAGAMFCLIKPQLEANQRRFENGNKGGRPKPKHNLNITEKEPRLNLDETKPKPNVNGNVNKNENVNDNKNDLFKDDDEERTRDKIPFERMMQIWNERIPKELSKCSMLSDKRKTAIKQRWKDSLNQNIENWIAFCDRLHKAEWLRGFNDRKWIADIDWAIRPDSIIKTMEGKYDNGNNEYTRRKDAIDAKRAAEATDFGESIERISALSETMF